MTEESQPTVVIDALLREQIKAFFAETQTQNVVGIVVLAFIIWISGHAAPLWSWLPGFLVACLMTLIRGILIIQYQRTPERRTARQWGSGQTLCTALNGLAWGHVTSSLCSYLLPYNQLLILTISAISASAAATEAFAYFRPSLAYIAGSQLPLALWFLFSSGEDHLTLGILLIIFVMVLAWQMVHRNVAFNEAIELRFKNERLVHQLANQTRITEEAGLAKSRFLAAASHDLRQPVQAVNLFFELLRPEMRLTEKGDAYFGKVKQALRTVSEMLATLLDVSRLDASTIKPDIQVLAVNDLLFPLMREFAPLAERKGLRWRMVPCALHVATDPVLLERILRNLISNALRYTPSGKVLLGCRRRGSRVLIQVWDTGIGIDEAFQRKVFDEFFQIGNLHRDHEQGLGLGLSIVERAARLLESPLSLTSELGKGSGFSLSLPLASPLSIADGGRASAPAQPYDMTGRRIVLVDGEEMVRSGMHTLLEKWGATVISGASVETVLASEACQAAPVDVLVVDVNIAADGDGLAGVARLRAQLGAGVPALIISGDTSDATRALVKASGCPMLLKPVRPWKLRQGICAQFPKGGA